jgi:uncharacterized phage protein gp47/JayE
MANNILYVPQVDYTSRDYLSIRNDLLDLISLYAPSWTSRDPSDLGITLIELFAYMGDSLNFYIDRAANEGFIGTASQRDSILQLATMFGYTPNKLAAATTILTLTNTGASDQTIPAGTLFGTSAVTSAAADQVFFETMEDVTVTAGSSAYVDIAEGFTITDEELGSSNGTPQQVFKLAYPFVIDGSVNVTVGGKEFSYISSFLDAGMMSYVFTTFNDSDGNTYIAFGDGINGSVPVAAAQILATYRSGSGAAGNVPVGVITYQLTNLVAGIRATNYEAATGGADEESTDSIRMNAPKALRSLSRAVSLKDYSSLALQYPGVSKAVAAAASLNSVTLYVAPSGDPGISGTNTTAAFDTLATSLYTFFTDRAAPNSSLTILPPTYVPIDIAMTVNVLPQYQQNTVTSNLLTTLRSLVALDNSFFADVIPVQYLMKAAAAVQGIDYVTVDILKKTANFYITSWSRSGTTITVNTSSAHGYSTGNVVRIASATSNVNLDGTWTLASASGTTMTFVNSAATGATASTAVVIPTQTPTGSTNITLSTTGSHNFVAGKKVYVTGVTPSGYNGVWTAQAGTTGSTLVLDIGSNPGAITVAGTVTLSGTVDLWQGVSTITCAVNEIPSEGNFVLTALGGIS